MADPYKLAFTLHGHSSDVRNLAVPNTEVPLLLSASRDGSAIVWGPSSSGGSEWDAKLRVEELERKYVSCVTMVNYQGQAYLVMGSQTGMLSTFVMPSLNSDPPALDAPMQSPQHTLIEHNQNICCIDASAGGLIATGSWDKTVIVWKGFKKAVEIKTHSQAVWAVKFVGEDRVLTASADKTITLHAIDPTNGTTHPLQSYTGHTDCVRGLSLTPDGSGFWSCGNDSLVNLYSFDKTSPIQSLSGHTSFVYAVAALPDGSGAISTGEDGTLRLWSPTELVQTIVQPSMSLWSCAVAPIPDGSGYYLVSSSADSMIRFFTEEAKYQASAQDLASWDEEVSQRKLDKSQVGDVKRSDLPGMEALGREGKKDGQVIMIKNNDNVEAYQWQQATSTWQQIGQVVDAIGSGRKQLYEGKEYDYVFDVDVSEGMPPLKLPFNVSENPWTAAQRFLDKYELPHGYAEQVVEFIHKNTEGVQLGTGNDSTYVDPFTGGSRYTGGGVTPGAAYGSGGSGGGGDPLTGGSRYTGGGVTPGASYGGGGGGDPLTGGSRYTGGGVTPGQSYGGGSDPLTGGGAYSTQPSSALKVLPVKSYLSFKKINAGAAQGKVNEFKAASPIDDATSQSLDEAFKIVAADKPSASETYDPTLLLTLIQQWDEAQRFPVIDMLRALALLSPVLGGAASAPGDLLQAAGWSSAWSTAKPRSTNQLLALRALANLFATGPGRQTMVAAAENGLLIELVKARQWAEVGTAKQPLATVALNFSILAVTGSLPASLAPPLLRLIVHILDNETADSETIYRASVALGNLLSSSVAGGLSVGDVNSAKSLVGARAGALKEKRLTDLSAEIQALSA